MFARNFIRTFVNANLNSSQNNYLSHQNINNVNSITCINKEGLYENRYFPLPLEEQKKSLIKVSNNKIDIDKSNVKFVLDLEENEISDILSKNLYNSLENGHFH